MQNERPGLRTRPLVLVSFHRDHWPLKHRIVGLARKKDWRILDLDLHSDELPPGLLPAGAFLDRAPDDPLIRQLRKLGCPVVRVGTSSHPRDSAVPAVIEDQAAAGRLAAEHFAERRFRHVGFVMYHAVGEWTPLYEALRARAVALGCECHRLVYSRLTKEQKAFSWTEKDQLRRREFQQWLQSVPKPIGLLAFSDNLGGRLTVAALDAGFAVPGQVAVLAHGNVEAICESAPVPLSAVDPGVGETAEAAVRLLQDLMGGKPRPKKPVLVPPRGIVVRESTDTLATKDPVVAHAVRYLWDHLDQNLSVGDVAAAVATPRRKLERAFHDQIGHGINAELRRRRLERCCELLRSTTLSITDLAPAIGFRDKNYLHAVFRRAYGMTPRKYRARNAEQAERWEVATRRPPSPGLRRTRRRVAGERRPTRRSRVGTRNAK